MGLVPRIENIPSYAQDIVDTVREPLLVLDATLRVRSANRAFYETFQVSPGETEGRLVYELGNGQWNIPALRTLLEQIVPRFTAFDDFEIEHTFPAIGRRVMLLNARKLRPGNHGELLVLAIEDVTERRRPESDLEALETYAQNIVDTVREPLLILDATLRVRSANRAFYQTFQVSPSETEGHLIYELGTGHWDIPDLRILLEDIVSKSSVFDDFEFEHNFPGIGRRVMLLNARKLRAGHHGELLVLAMEDVTARKLAEEALLEAGALQSAIFNSANFSSIATDEKGVIQIFNVGAERMLGYSAAEVTNRITPADISDPEEVIARAKTLSAELGTTILPGFEALVFKASRGIEDIYELTYIRKDGSRFPAIVSVTALREAEGRIIGYLLIGTDNTARKHIEAERMLLDQRVRDQQFYTRSLIESNIDALMTTDPRGIITDVNKQMEALTGCTRDELIGAPFRDYFTDPERAEAGIRLVLAQGKVTNYELTARARDGQETVVSYNASTFHDRDRKLQGVFAAARDVTERSRFELQMREQAAKLSDLHRRKDEFLAMLSHELRSPLAPIANAVRLLGLAKGTESLIQQQARGVIERQMGQLQHLVDDLLEVSRITSGRVQLRQVLVAVSGIVEVALETSRPLIDQRRHELTVSLPPEPIWLYADASRLEQVLVNLLTNAAKYTEEGGHIWLTIQREGDECVIRVRDTGVGITPALLPCIFELFTQGERSLDRSQGGLGIGLALVQRLTDLHGGRVEAHSTLGQGSEFVVRLPLQAPGTSHPPVSITDSTQPVTRPLRVLVVDDNVDTAVSISMLLKASGHAVRTANDGISAVQAAIDYRPDVVLLDIGLPGLTGYEVAKRIRQIPALASAVLVAVTGYGQDSDRQRSQQAGFNHHLVKPARFEQLQQILATASEHLN
ncbi:MAG: PAS domain S-box protein [Planctomycetota bacterium]|nr:PAS domain S-box protein [Planctomycetota bacterium]